MHPSFIPYFKFSVSKPEETIIRANRPWWDLEIKDFFRYKDLLYLLVRRDFVTSYKQTILGPFWIVLQALMGSAVFTVVFGKIAGLSTDGHPAFLFYLSGTLAWQYFSTVFGSGCNALQANIALFSKVYFPRLIPPISQAIFALFNFCFQLLVFFLALVVYYITNPEDTVGLRIEVFLLPLTVFQTAILATGMGLIISAASAKYRDLARIAGMAAQFLMYATPVIYPVSEIPQKYQSFLAWNPLTFIVESYRYLLLGHSTACTWEFAIPSILLSLLIFFVGIIFYNQVQRTYVDFV
jgi:lipopolysaccharide transport system permease protein